MMARRPSSSIEFQPPIRGSLLTVLLATAYLCGAVVAQEPPDAEPAPADQPAAVVQSIEAPPEEAQTEDAEAKAEADPPAGVDADVPEAEIGPSIREVLDPVLERLEAAKTLRATVKMTLTNSIGDEVLDTNEGLFQIASKTPNLLALTAKFDAEAVRMISTGEVLDIQLSRKEYVELEAPESFAELTMAMPIQLGPQPEPMLWLSLAGADAGKAILSGLSSIELVESEEAEDQSTATIRATRPEGVRWELKVSRGEDPRPRSLVIDMTEMIAKTNNVQLPEGFSIVIGYEFERWDVDEPLDEEMFSFTPPEDARKFDSLADYLLTRNQQHPLLGKPTPTFTGTLLSGEEITLAERPEEVVVLDFWATWCPPCIEALPEMAKLATKYADRGVRIYAVNVAEEREAVEEFLKERELDLPIMLDPEGEISAAFSATAIPQTVLIGKGGRIEAVHVGFDPDQSAELLSSEIETLLAGRRIYEAKEEQEADVSETGEAEATGTGRSEADSEEPVDAERGTGT